MYSSSFAPCLQPQSIEGIMDNVLKLRTKSNKRIQFLISVLFVFFAGSSAFAQKADVESRLNDISINRNDNAVGTAPVNASSSVKLNSSMNFILWFMGTKEDVNCTKSKDTFFTKKSILTSGREPNHLLLKTLLKKALNVESC